uniref:CSON006683 protein n=1 Tax=Culicoides sonorensis TaxID=179676 RepID=A0A336KBY9_CULSO
MTTLQEIQFYKNSKKRKLTQKMKKNNY